MKNQVLLLILVPILIFSCANPHKLIDSGDYDRALQTAVRKVRGKDNIKDKYVLAIEEAFKKAQDRDMRLVTSLKKEGREENWEKVNDIYNDISKRQALVEPLLPLYSKEGYKAEFKFVKVDELSIESREKAAEYLYNRAIRLIEEAETTGLRQPAREAYYELEKIDDFYTNYRDKDRLMQKAEFLGTEQWLVRMVNNSNAYLPGEFERLIMKLDVGDLNGRWETFNLLATDDRTYDYEVKINIENINVSPNQEKERQFDESKEIEDGFEYVLDANGNVMKDSTGNDIKIPKKVFIKATVLEVTQTKYALVTGSWDLVDLREGNLLKTEPLSVESGFENYASTLIGGDKRALTKDTKERLGNKPVPFPTDEEMLLQAADVLKGRIKTRIRAFR